jgi:modulator of FtsH protease HflC
MKANIKWVCAGIVLSAFLLLSSIFFTIDETQTAIVTRFGRPLDGTTGPGLHAKLPWPIDSVVRLDSRLLIFDGEPTEMLTQDKKNVIIDCFICWKIVDPLRFARTVKTRAEAEARLLDISSSELGAQVGSEPMEHFINTKPDLVKLREISKKVAAKVDQMVRPGFGIQVMDLQINGLNLPAQNRASVIKRMRAERDRIATKYRSEGEEEALKIEAQAAAERSQILSEAASKSEAVRGRGEAKAMEIFADAYGKDPEFYRFLRSLQSYEAFIDKDTTIFVESNSKLMKVLNGE